MSIVTGIMLILGPADWGEESFHEVQAWLSEHCSGKQLKETAGQGGGFKHPPFEAW